MVAVSRWIPVLIALALTALVSGCGAAQFSSSTGNVSNLGAPTISQQPMDTTVGDGAAATFTVTANGTAPLSYQWMENGVPIPGGTGSTLRISEVSFTDDGAQITVIVRNNVGSITSTAATLTVTPVAPSIVTQPADQSIVTGNTATFVVKADGSAPLTYQWSRNGTVIPGATAASYTTPTETVADSGSTFTVTISNSQGAVTSRPALLTVTPFGISLIAGHLGGFGTIDGTAGGARFFNPKGLAAYAAGNVYVADSTRNLIRKVTAAGIVTTISGAPGIDGARDGAAAQALFSQPGGIAVDTAGNLYVADTGNDTIRKITAAGQVSTVAGTAVTPGAVDGTGGAALFNAPAGIAVDTAGNLYVADSGNNTIRKITAGGVVSTLAGTAGTAGSVDGTGVAAQFDGPQSLAVDAGGNVYVADTFNNTIRKITPAGVVTTLAGTAGTFGNQDGPAAGALFSRLYGIAVDAAGNLYVTDIGNQKIRKVSATLIVSTLAGSGAAGHDDGTGDAAQFSTPWGIAVDAAGNLYTADYESGTVRKISPANAVTTLAGLAPRPGATDGTGAEASFDGPEGVATDLSGNIYVADTSNHIVRKITPGGAVTTIAGTVGTTGTTDGTAAAARFNGPYGIAVDAAGNIFVTDSGSSTIRKITPAGVVTTLAGIPNATGSADGPGITASFNFPTGLTIDAAGNLFVTDSGNNTIREITPAGFVTTLAGTAGVAGSTDGTGAAALFNSPQAIAVDATGNLFIADSANQTIRMLAPSGAVTTLAGTAGHRGTDDATGAAASFYFPAGIAVDAAGNLYVADTSAQTIRKVTAAGVVTTLAGVPRSEGVILGALPGSLNQPAGLALLAGTGTRLVVADYAENSILLVTLP